MPRSLPPGPAVVSSGPATPPAGSATPPLLLSRDAALVDEVRRLAAPAGVEPVVGLDSAGLLRAWVVAPVVLVGADVVDEVAGLAPERRGGVHVVGWAGVPDRAFRAAVALGAETVTELPSSAEWLVELLTDCGDRPAAGRLLGVVGGAGGAGASTLACAVGQVAASRGSVLVVDTDPLGPGLERLLGLEDVPGVGWESLVQTTGRLSSRALREAVRRRERLGVLGWSQAVPGELPAFAAREALAAAVRGHDLVVVDLARTGALTVELASRCDRVVVVAPATLAGTASTQRLLAALAPPDPVLVLRPGPVPAADVERVVGVPACASVADQRGLDEALDLGLGPVRSRRARLARAAGAVLAA